jgi:splicing factor 3B subunit 1
LRVSWVLACCLPVIECAHCRKLASYTAPKDLEVPVDESAAAIDANVMGGRKIVDRESEYSKRRLNRELGEDGQSYAERMKEAQLARERENTLRNIELKKRREEEVRLKKESAQGGEGGEGFLSGANAVPVVGEAERSAVGTLEPGAASSSARRSRWDSQKISSWDERNDSVVREEPKASKWDATPAVHQVGDVVAEPTGKKSRWDATPLVGMAQVSQQHPTSKKSRWDATPMVGMTPSLQQTPMVPSYGATPAVGSGAAGLETPFFGASSNVHAMHGQYMNETQHVQMTPELYQQMKIDREIERRNRPLSDAELDDMLPGPSEGYRIVNPPAGYDPIRTPARKITATPVHGSDGYQLYTMPEDTGHGETFDVPISVEGLPDMKVEDQQYFGKLLNKVDESALTVEEAKERKILKLLLKVKNGTPQQRKSSLKQLTEKARDFGAGPLLNQILPLLMSPTLEDQERHLLVKVIDRILFRLEDLVRPHVHKILVVIEPLLIDEDYYARVEGREIIANLAKAAGLATMIAAMRPDIDNVDEYVRNTTARAFSVVSSALGIQTMLPFLKAVCMSKKSWQARHTGIKIVQQTAILMGCAVLPHLTSLVDIIKHGLTDDNQKVKAITALAISALAEAAAPYGIESFDDVLEPLWKGVKLLRGKVLASFLKAIGYIIPLMDAMYANYYTREVMLILLREFQTPDEEMKKIVLKVVRQCVATDGVEPEYIRAEIIPEFFKHFWVRRMALDRRNYKALVETTVAIADKAGCSEIVSRIVSDLKDESEPYRKMVAETIDKVVDMLGTADVDARLEELLIDGLLYAYQEQDADETPVILNGFGTVINALGERSAPYLPQISGTIKWRLNNKSAKIREQAADLVSKIAAIVKKCDEEKLLSHLAIILFENLGEEYPEVLGSILRALNSIVSVIGMDRMTPPIRDLVPRLTPILRNRHDKVQEECIKLVGSIADRAPEQVPAREWMRICFELLDMLRSTRKSIRRASVSTFGHIAKAIGPQDVLVTLLNNLKVQERQNRVCTTVAIAIVAESCAPFTVIPALMNEYRVPEMNVQNGVLKATSFLFEYIGEMGKDYVYAVTPLLEDALMDRDLVHRQTAAFAVQHIAHGVIGLGCEDALTHLLNYIWPNIFEDAPHMVQAVNGAIEACRLALGPAVLLNYLLQGLFHPAQIVRRRYWRLFNTLYVGSQPALVPFYPDIPDSGKNTTHIDDFDVFV